MSRRLIAVLLVLTGLCSACTSHSPHRGEQPPEGQYAVYFATASGRGDDAALDREFQALSVGTVEGLMELLLSGPDSDSLVSPFPQGTALRGWEIAEDGIAIVDLSEAYEGLSGAELTLADGCIVLTLCQLERVEAVYLTVEGHPRPFRDQVLAPSDFLLDNETGEEST